MATKTMTPEARVCKALYDAGEGPSKNRPVGTGLAYLRSILVAMQPVADPTVDSMGCNHRGRLYYRPDYVTEQSDEQLRYLVVVQAMHILLDHHRRSCAMGLTDDTRKRWTTAASLEVASCLAAIRHLAPHAPPNTLLPKNYDFPEHLPAERYFALVAEQEQQPPSAGGGGSAEDDATGEPGSGGGGSAAGGEDPQQHSPDGEENDGDQAQTGAGGQENGQSDGDGELRDQLASEAAMDAARERAIQELSAEAAKNAGNAPGSLSALVKAVSSKPTVSWTRVLARSMASDIGRVSGCDDYSRVRPSKRQAAVGWDDGAPLLPCMVGSKVRALLAIDVSGSMSDDEIALLVREVGRCCDTGNVTLDVITFDTRVQQVWRNVDGNSVIKRDGIQGRGGTDLRPVFEWAAEQREHYDMIAVGTDGYGPAPQHPPKRSRVTWLQTEKSTQPAEWGRCIKMT